MRLIMELADRANQYIDRHKPWVMAKDPAQATAVQEVCSVGINCFRMLMIYLQPVLPRMAERAATYLRCPALGGCRRTAARSRAGAFEPLLSVSTPRPCRPWSTAIARSPPPRRGTGRTGATRRRHRRAMPRRSRHRRLPKVDLRVARIIAAEPVRARTSCWR
jgi:methionyl-tRNA synthetase